MDKSKESARGSGPIPDHKVFGESLLFGASVRTLRRRFVQPGCTNHTDYFCGRPSSAALRRISAMQGQVEQLQKGTQAVFEAEQQAVVQAKQDIEKEKETQLANFKVH